MNNLSPYCGFIVDAKIRASDKDLPVHSVKYFYLKTSAIVSVHKCTVAKKKFLFRSKTMRCLGCQHDAGYSKPQLVWGGILLSACPFWIRFCQLNFCLNFSNSFSINFQEKFLLTLLFGPSFFINFQDNFAPTLLFGTPVKYIWNSRHPGRSKVQKSRKSSGDNCQKILSNWLYPPGCPGAPYVVRPARPRSYLDFEK